MNMEKGEKGKAGRKPSGVKKVKFQKMVVPEMVEGLEEASRWEPSRLLEVLKAGLGEGLVEVPLFGDPRPVAERAGSPEYEANLKASWPGAKERREDERLDGLHPEVEIHDQKAEAKAELKKLPGVKPASELRGPSFVKSDDLARARQGKENFL